MRLGRAAPDAPERVYDQRRCTMLTIGRPAADCAGARPYHRIGIASSNPGASSPKRCQYDRAAAPSQDYPFQLTIILDGSVFPRLRVARQGPVRTTITALGTN